jgi:hypothetical protein
VPCLFLSLLLLQQIHPRLLTPGAPWLPASPVPPPGTEDARAGVRWRDDVGGGLEPGHGRWSRRSSSRGRCRLGRAHARKMLGRRVHDPRGVAAPCLRSKPSPRKSRRAHESIAGN